MIRYYYTDESFLGFSGERKTIVNACFLICSYQHLHRGSILLSCKRHYLTICQYSTAKLHIIFQPTKKERNYCLPITGCFHVFRCHFTFPTPLPSYSPLALFRNLFCPSSITSESTSSMSVSRCRRGRQTDVVDVDFGGVSVSFWRLCCRSRVLFVSLHDEAKMSNIITITEQWLYRTEKEGGRY